MGCVAARPHPALDGLVDAYVGYRYAVPDGAIHHGLPSPAATFIVSLDAPLHARWPDQDYASYQTLLAGLTMRHTIVHGGGLQYGIQVSLTPAGHRRLMGVPVAAVSDQMIDPADVAARTLGAQLAERLADCTTWSQRFAELDGTLLARIDLGSTAARPELGQAWQLIAASAGAMRVGVVAQEVGWSSRHLTDEFIREYGVTPKQTARLFRFAFARSLARHDDLATVAIRAGYSDQAHLTRDWRSLAGRTPRQTVGEAFFVPV
ncbi:MAG: AraC family transcriptional regulator [Micrococcales bacterium]|nr:MAG: AraC family transcriptional regulator [Micrococcales bacterium]PIE25999.1 MAG: AraC family transcriptional regulator [Micrococcales bacterium]